MSSNTPTDSGEGDKVAIAPPIPPNEPPIAAEAAVPPSILNTPTATKRPYVYRDFAQDNTDYGGTTSEEISIVDGRGLTNQKLPAKLHAMLSDPDLVTTITWMPHGRSWKILNRDLFSRFALPKYFGHTNHASFIRIVNAWGFRRVVATGPDRDTYYHELFLRSKTNLHVKMKRLPTSHRKTPMDKNESSPNFYELSEQSPLPETKWLTSSSSATATTMGRGGMSSATGTTTGMGMVEGYAGMMGMGGGLMGNMLMQQQQQQQQQQQLMSQSMGRMMPGMGMMGNPFYPSVNPAAAAAAAAMGGMTSSSSGTTAPNVATMPTGRSQSHLSENENLLQLQRENDTLMRQLLQLQRQMNPPSSMTATSSTSNAIEEGGASTSTAAATALHHDNQQLIRQVMQLQEELPPELRIEIPPELLGGSSQPQQQSEGKTEEETSGKTPHEEV